MFDGNPGTIFPWTAKLAVDPEASPKFCKPRPIPFAMREKVDEELARLERIGVLEKVTHSNWATPIVVVPKQDGTVRICGDYRATINTSLNVDEYPLPKPEDMFATLAGGQSFSKLDLTHALAKSCKECASVKRAPSKVPLHPWTWPQKPWQRVHLDFAGPFQGSMFFLAVDACSKWPEVEVMTSTTTGKTLDVLRRWFSSNGLPEAVVTDNGPQFVSEEFEEFCKLNGIKHLRSAPYHPASNGLVERFVQSLKQFEVYTEWWQIS